MHRLRTDAEATFEYHLLNGIQGKVLDPKDGATVIDYFTEFAITPATEVNFDLAATNPGSGVLRKRYQALIESVEAICGRQYRDGRHLHGWGRHARSRPRGGAPCRQHHRLWRGETLVGNRLRGGPRSKWS